MIVLNNTSSRFLYSLPYDVRHGIVKNLEKMENKIRSIFPKVVFTSGFRSPGHNKSVGGVINSLHQYGCALDIRKGTVDPKLLEKHGFRVLRYSWGYHVDGGVE